MQKSILTPRVFLKSQQFSTQTNENSNFMFQSISNQVILWNIRLNILLVFLILNTYLFLRESHSTDNSRGRYWRRARRSVSRRSVGNNFVIQIGRRGSLSCVQGAWLQRCDIRCQKGVLWTKHWSGMQK